MGSSHRLLNTAASRHIAEHAERKGPAVFDARGFAVPGPTEAIVAIEERRRDCIRNAIQSVGHWAYGHRAMLNRPTREVAEALRSNGIGMDTWRRCHTGGIAIERVGVLRRFTTEELEALPAQHEARRNADLEIERSATRRVEAPEYSDRPGGGTHTDLRVARGNPDPFGYAGIMRHVPLITESPLRTGMPSEDVVNRIVPSRAGVNRKGLAARGIEQDDLDRLKTAERGERALTRIMFQWWNMIRVT